ncbi:MAG: hypothetical protein WDM81_04180 [Rhizomicrobium sp.]
MTFVAGLFRVSAWIAASLLIIVAAFAVAALMFGVTVTPIWMTVAAVALLVFSSLLFLPPLWRSIQNRWIDAARVIVACALAYSGLFLIPIETHAVKLDLPRPAHHR